LGSRDYWVGVRELGELERLSFRVVKQWVERNGRSHHTGRAQKERGPGFDFRDSMHGSDQVVSMQRLAGLINAQDMHGNTALSMAILHNRSVGLFWRCIRSLLTLVCLTGPRWFATSSTPQPLVHAHQRHSLLDIGCLCFSRRLFDRDLRGVDNVEKFVTDVLGATANTRQMTLADMFLKLSYTSAARWCLGTLHS